MSESIGSPSFTDDIAVSPVANGAQEWRAQLRERWNVGRTQNGGVLLATVVTALSDVAGHPDPLTITGHFLAAAEAGEATIRGSLVKPGRTYATATGELHQADRERVRVVGAFGDLGVRAAEGPSMLDSPPSAIPEPDRCDDLFDHLVRGPAGERSLTKSLRNFEIRVDPDGGWGDPSAPASLRGWIRFRGEDTVTPAMVVALADAFPPTILAHSNPGWLPTIELTVHVFGRPPVDKPWLRADLRTRCIQGGLLDEDGELWDSTGQLVARFRQMAMLIRRDG